MKFHILLVLLFLFPIALGHNCVVPEGCPPDIDVCFNNACGDVIFDNSIDIVNVAVLSDGDNNAIRFLKRDGVTVWNSGNELSREFSTDSEFTSENFTFNGNEYNKTIWIYAFTSWNVSGFYFNISDVELYPGDDIVDGKIDVGCDGDWDWELPNTPQYFQDNRTGNLALEVNPYLRNSCTNSTSYCFIPICLSHNASYDATWEISDILINHTVTSEYLQGGNKTDHEYTVVYSKDGLNHYHYTDLTVSRSLVFVESSFSSEMEGEEIPEQKSGSGGKTILEKIQEDIDTVVENIRILKFEDKFLNPIKINRHEIYISKIPVSPFNILILLFGLRFVVLL